MNTNELEIRIKELELELSNLKSKSIPANSSTKPVSAESKEIFVLNEKALKKSGDELQDNFRMLNEVAHNMFDMVAFYSNEGKILYATPSYKRVLGYMPQVGKDMMEYVHPDDIEYIHAAITEFRETHVPKILELRLRKADEKYIWVESIGNIYKNKDGEIAGLISSTRDVSERKQVEDEMSEKNKFLKKLNLFALELANLSANDNLEAFITKQVKEIAGAEMGVFSEYNSENRIIIPKHIAIESGLLKKGERLLGTKVQNFHTVVSDEMYHELSTKLVAVRETIYEASFGAIPRSFGAAIKALLKVDRFIALSFFIEGKLYGSSLLAMKKEQPDPPKEILENFIHLASLSLRRKQADMALKESHELVSLFIKHSPIYTFIKEVNEIESKVIHASENYIDMIGITGTEMAGKTMEELYPYEFAKKIAADDWRVVSQGNILNLEEELNNKFYFTIKFPIIQGDKHLIAGYTIDITDRKKAEQTLKESEAKLSQLNADKDRFISILGHDLKSPFNNLLGLSELLRENIRKYDIDIIEELAVNINISAQCSFNLLDDLLQWAMAQQSNIVYEPQSLSLTDVCQDTLKVLQPSASAKNIVIKLLAEDHLNVFADIDMLKAVLRNLVSNAIKFTNTGGAIRITTEQKDSNVTISVSDNGIGIPPENLANLFDISEVTTTKGTANETGTGLGLILCKEFVEKHGGKIWVESEVGKGSDIRFTLTLST